MRTKRLQRTKAPVDIDQVFADGKAIDRAVRLGVRDALIQHMHAGVSVAVWENGKAVLKPAEEVLASAGPNKRRRAKSRATKR